MQGAGDSERFGSVMLRVKARGQVAANLSGREFGLGVGGGAFGAGAGEVRVHSVDDVKSPVIADVVVVRVGVGDRNGQAGQGVRDFFDISDAQAGVEQQGPLRSDDQV